MCTTTTLPSALERARVRLAMASTIVGFASWSAGNAALAQTGATRLGDHPAVVVQRLYAQQGYDYAARFYPHPAWLYLLPEAPRPMVDHPAVIVFRREQEQQKALAEAAAARAAQVAATPTPR